VPSGCAVRRPRPRTAPQARELDAISAELSIPLEVAVYLDVPDPELTRRLLARAEIEGRSDDNARRDRSPARGVHPPRHAP
jgi:adenylate kinase family enzyme